MRPSLLALVPALVMALVAGRAAAQDTNMPAPFAEAAPAPGWTFTPAAGVSQLWDDNVLVQGKGADLTSDFVSVFSPHAGLQFNSPRTVFDATYSGAFELYRQLDSLNSYGQFENVSGRRRTTPRTSFFVQQQFSATPTTEAPVLVGVPFVRTGARVADVKGGVDHAFSKRTTIEASYDYQWIDFDKDPLVGTVLLGGHGGTAAATVRHQFSMRTTLITDYGVQHATIIDGSTFTVQHALAGGEHRFSPAFTAFAEGGISHVATSTFGGAETAPSFQAGAERRFGRVLADASYSRAFVPAYGVGDTLDSRDLGAHVRTTITRRVYAEGSLDWRNDRPLQTNLNTLGEVPLRSLWYTAVVGYAASPWLRLEGFFNATHQDANRPGGELNRNRMGIQVTTTKPMRVR